MDKNKLIGFVLMFLVLIGYSWYNGKNASKYEAQMKEQMRLDSIAAAKADSIARIEQVKADSAKVNPANPFKDSFAGTGGTTVIENEMIRVTLAHKGGQLKSVELKDEKYQSRNRKGTVVLFDDANDASFTLTLDGRQQKINTADLCFSPTKATKNSVVLTAGGLDIIYSLKPNSYLLDMDVKAGQGYEAFNGTEKKMTIEWSEKMTQQEKGYDFENRYATITYRDTDNDTEELSSTGGDEEESEFENKVRWVAFKTQFFSQVLIAEQPVEMKHMASKREDKSTGMLKKYDATMTTELDPSGVKPTSFHWYLGPNKFDTLKENEKMLSNMDNLDLRSLVYLGWPIVRWINRFFFLYAFDFLSGMGLHMAIVLLILTILVKVLVFPLMKKSYLSSAKMRVLRPKMDEIAKKYPKPEDAMVKQQETMKMYSEYGVSPMGGCLPMLIQMPIWIALFNFIPNYIELRGVSFLWADDMSAYDDIINFGTHIWAIGDHLSIFCVLWCASTIFSSMITQRQQQYAMTAEQQQQMGMMKWMMYLMPLIFFFSFNSYASGLNYYYFISTLSSVLLMWWLRKTTDDDKLLAELEQRRKERMSDASGKKRASSMMERLQAMQEKQQELLRQQEEARKQRQQ